MTDDDTRRRFLARSGALALGAALAPGCAAVPRRPTLGVSPAEVLAQMEHGLARIRAMPPGLIRRQLPWAAPDASIERDAKRTLEALVVAEAVRAVPRDAWVPADFALRLHEVAPALDRCLDTWHEASGRMTEETRRRLEAQARRWPDLPTEAAAWIDERAAEIGVVPASRARLRRSAAEMKIRMRRQSPLAVIDEVSEKVGRLVARRDSPQAAAHRASAAAVVATPRAGLPPNLGRRLDTPRASAPVRLVEGRPLPTPGRRRWSDDWDSPGDEEVRLGAILMPFGLITCGVLLWVGLGLLIYGVVENETWDGRPRLPER